MYVYVYMYVHITQTSDKYTSIVQLVLTLKC